MDIWTSRLSVTPAQKFDPDAPELPSGGIGRLPKGERPESLPRGTEKIKRDGESERSRPQHAGMPLILL